MAPDASALPRPLLALFAAACFVIVSAGLKAAEGVALPVLFSVFMAMLVWPLVRVMVRAGTPKGLAILLSMLLLASAMVGGAAIVTESIAEFTASLPRYQAPLELELARLNAWLAARGLGNVAQLETQVDPGALFGAMRVAAAAVVGILSNVLVVVVTTAILLLEASELGTKLEVAFGQQEGGGWIGAAGSQVQRYLVLKTVISLVTGLLVGLWVWAWGLEFAILFGLVAFLLNFVPAIGSIVASIPAIILALVDLGFGGAVGIAVGYLAVNVTLGNFLEPRIMGRRLGLSPFVVVLCLFFWGYLWGPGGMLIGVPMTVILKLALETSPNTRWLAILLGGAKDASSMPAPVVPPSHHDTGVA